MVYRKKAQGFGIVQLVFVLAGLFGFAMASMVGYKLFVEWNNDLQADNELSADNQAIVDDLETRYPNIFDGAFIFVLVFAWLFLMVASFQAGSHPILFVIAIIFAALVLVLGIYLANSYDDTFDDPDFTGVQAMFPMIDSVMNNLVIVIIGFFGSAVLAMYSGARFE